MDVVRAEGYRRQSASVERDDALAAVASGPHAHAWQRDAETLEQAL